MKHKVTKTNPIDSELAAGKIPDYPKYSKKTIMESNHFQEVAAKAHKRDVAEMMKDPKKKAEFEKAEQTTNRLLNDASRIIGFRIETLQDLEAEPKKHQSAIPLVLREILATSDSNYAWGLSITLKKMKPQQKYIGSIFNAFKELCARPDADNYDQAVFKMSEILRGKLKGREGEIKEILEAKKYNINNTASLNRLLESNTID